MERKPFLETLEDRRLMAVGPRLIGVQPNNSDLFLFEPITTDPTSNLRNVAPREITLRFDENQVLDASTLAGIRLTRGGLDGRLSKPSQPSLDDVVIVPGFIGVSKSPEQNEVVVRFAEALPDDVYRVEVFGAGSANPLANSLGDAFVPTLNDGDGDLTKDTVDFELDLGPQVVAVVPQPVRRDAQGKLTQLRNQIEVYFNNDDLLSGTGSPAQQAWATNPDFYQLIFTSSTVRNTDDVVIKPTQVAYNTDADLAVLTFGQDLDRLVHPDTGALIGPGTFRLRIGTDEAAPLPPQSLSPAVRVSSDFNTGDQVVVQFVAARSGEQDIHVIVSRHDLGSAANNAPRVRVNVVGRSVLVDLNQHAGEETTAQELVDAINGDPSARQLIAAMVTSGAPSTKIGNRAVNYSPLDLVGPGSSFDTATDLTDGTDTGPVLVVTGSGNAFTDGTYFELKDPAGGPVPKKFEFDRDAPPALDDPTSVAIVVNDNMTQAEVAGAIADAINGAGFGIVATRDGNRVRLEGDKGVDISAGVPGLAKEFQSEFDSGQLLEVLLGGRAFQDGNTFQITPVQGTPVTFEFDEGWYLNLLANDFNGIADQQYFTITQNATPVTFEFVDTRVDSVANGTNVAIPFDDTFLTRDSLANAIVSAIQSQIDAGVLTDLAPRHLGNGSIHLGGTTSHVVDTSGTPASALLPDATKVGVVTPQSVAVRFVRDASFIATDVARAVAQAVNSTTLISGLKAVAVGTRVSVDGDSSINSALPGLQTAIQSRFDSGPVLLITKDHTGFGDGQTVRIRDDHSTVLTFEFDKGAGVTPGNIPVTITGAETISQMALLIANAVNKANRDTANTATPFRVTATAQGDRVYLTADQTVELDGRITAMQQASQGMIVSSSIDPRPFALDYLGSNSDPGHRQTPEAVGGSVEQHLNQAFADKGRDGTPGVTTITYNFREDLGSGFTNVVTDQQRMRAREAFQLWGEYLGVQFLESAGDGLTIATADMNVLSAAGVNVLDFPSNNFRVRVDPNFGNGLLVMDSTIQWNDDYGEDWFLNTMVGIGSMLGLELANDLPVTNLMARYTSSFRFLNVPDPEPYFPGNADIIHGQHLYRTDGVDVDLYRFTIDAASGREGLFTAETFAERLPNASLLDTVLTLYRQNPDGSREIISRNDDYYSRDSYLEANLGPGVYYIAVSARGNTDFDPTIDDTGLGGTSQGAYDLRLNFRSQIQEENTIRDQDRTPTSLDGDADGIPGGVFNFWFQTQPLDRILEVTGNGQTFQDGQTITITNNRGASQTFEFDSNGSVRPGNAAIAFTASSSASQIASELATRFSAEFGNDTDPPNDDFALASGSQVVFRSNKYGRERTIVLDPTVTGIAIHGRQIFVDKTAGPNADGSLGQPFSRIAGTGTNNAFGSSQPGDIVRVVGNGGLDGKIETPKDNLAYEFGFGTLPGQILSDGTEMAVPRGVTVMVDPGAVFKLRRSWIGVGSSSTTVNREGGALQVLGAPILLNSSGAVIRDANGKPIPGNVYFTSWLNENIGFDTHLPTTKPSRGDWGGIVYRVDVDKAASRPNLEEQGIFLNYANYADISYGGGGNVVIDSIQQVVNPIQIVGMRPTISFNTITNSADAAMSAAPDSFAETNFHAPQYQKDGQFTSDYQRVGPDIHGNRIFDNSTNGLFIRIETPAGDALRSLTVSGRIDDTDIVHVLTENLVIQGSSGDPYLDLERPSLDHITFSARSGGNLTPGVTYSYKIVFVDINGFEGRPSTAKAVVAGDTAIQLNQLPPVDGDFVRRRIYRSDNPANGYRLVAEIDGSSNVYVDPFATSQLGAVLQRDPPVATGVTLATQSRGSLPAGTYEYRIVFVDAQGREGASSDPTVSIALGGIQGGIVLNNLPPTTGEYVGRRIYRSTAGAIAPYTLVAEIDAQSTQYIDDGVTLGGYLDIASFGVVRARPHARLAIDPSTVVKLQGARIEVDFGAQFIAEGLNGQEVIFTSRLDDSYGAGGTYDTNNDDLRLGGEETPQRGEWGGLFLRPLSSASIDHALIAFGGGVSQIEGTFSAFNVIEVHQADLRLTHSVIENNTLGTGGQGPLDRFGRGYNLPATIFVRAAQPIIVDNIFRDNNVQGNSALSAPRYQMPVITINANSLTADNIVDYGRSRGGIGLITEYGDNRGPLVRDNRLSNNAINAMVVRGEELTTESVWDDTDIAHVLTNQFDQQDSRNAGRKWAFDEVVIPEYHTLGGLRLQSSPTESLVIKLSGAGHLNNNYSLIDDGAISNRNAYNGAGFTVTGRRFEIDDRVGGMLHVVGQPGFPVVLTSLHDDTVGAGIRPDDSPQTDTNNNGIATIPRPNDWRSIRLDQYSNDRNVEITMEMEPAEATAPGLNATTFSAQVLGDLAANEQAGDENLRMGFYIHGLLNEPNDIDVYSFGGTAGTEVWIDIDRTQATLDTVIELLDANGTVLARSDNTIAEVENGRIDFISPLRPDVVASPLRKQSDEKHQSGLFKDNFSTNALDAGMRIALPGTVGTRSTFHIRVRSKDGLTSGVYQLQVRARESDEFPASTVRFADIRYANNGVEVIGLPAHSPLLGEAAEDESAGANAAGVGSNWADNGSFFQDPIFPGDRPQDIGNLLESDRTAISVAGTVSSANDVDIYTFDVTYLGINAQNQSTHYAPALFDVDYADALVRFNSTLSVFDSSRTLVYIGRDSNVAEDRPGPLQGNDLDDLSRGSTGSKDPFIGPVELIEGQYYAAMTSSALMPSVLDQFTTPFTTNPLVRLEPVNSVTRLAEDHVESSGGSTAQPPIIPQLISHPTGGTGTRWQVTSNRGSDSGHGLTGSAVVSSGGPAVAGGSAAAGITIADPNQTGSGTPLNVVQPMPGVYEVETDDPDYVAGQLLVGFEPGIDAAARDSLLQAEGATLLKYFDFISTTLIQLPWGTTVEQAAATFALKDGVAFAGPNFVYTTTQVPNDPMFPAMYGLDRIDAPEAWDITTGSPNTVVAVIDTGVDYTHPDLANNMWQNPGEVPSDGIDNDGNGYVDDVYGIDTANNDTNPMDDDGHGTHVAGTIGAVGNNGIGVTGVNWNTKVMALKFLGIGGGSTAGAIEAINYMTRMKANYGINVVVSNNSWGGFGASAALQAAIDVSINAGIPFVAAAGNFSINNDVFPFYPASYDSAGIISVAASDQIDRLASFSHYGRTTVDIAAPGVDILSTVPNGGYDGTFSGTSMASPHVAGVAALIAAQSPGISVSGIKSAILNGGDRIPALRGTSVTGARLNAFNSLTARTAGQSFWFGDETLGNTGPGTPQGSLTSNTFSLGGYSAEDLPALYFNYYLDSAPADLFEVVVVNAGGTATTVASTNPTGFGGIEPLFQGRNSVWRQARIDLSRFANQEGLKLRFDYKDNSANSIDEGVYVDDLIIGFAERGEMVTGASSSSQFVADPKFVVTDISQGDYQLEIRSATDYAHYDSDLDALVLDESIDTNDRFALQTTLIAPAGNEVIDGQTFTISDGIHSEVFEFEDPEAATGVIAGHVEIPYKSRVGAIWVADRDYVIARRIRDAINNARVQTTLRITAAMADGEVSGTASKSNKVNLFGSSVVAQLEPFAITETTTDANQLRDKLLGAGIRVPATSSNASFTGSDTSAGFFVGGRNLLGLDSGVILSTGDVRLAAGPNNSDSATGHASRSGDADLDTEFSVATTDSTSLEFDFEFTNPANDDLYLNFVFASEEYTESTGAVDAFAVFVDGVNIALVPGTPDPVSIDTINGTDNASLFRNNDPDDGGQFLKEIGYDGFTTRLVARAMGLGGGIHRIKIVLSDVNDRTGDTAVFLESLSLASSEYIRTPSGIESIRHTGKGDQNLERPQGVVLVHSNSISHVKNFGVVADAGLRDTDGLMANTSTGTIISYNSSLKPAFVSCNNGDICVPDVIDFGDFIPGGFGTDFATYLTPVQLQNPHPGPARNLVVENLPAHGGFAPSVIIANNTISDGGIGGVHVSGSSRTYEVMPQRPPGQDRAGTTVYPSQTTANNTAGDMVNDGDTLTITAFGQTVVFEFEDLSGSGTDNTRWAPIGSSTACGDGWADGRIPIFYRRTGNTCNAQHPQIQNLPPRTLGYTQIEMAVAIKDAIDSSPLVSNDTTLTVRSQVSLGRHPGGDDVFGIHGTTGSGRTGIDPAVYVENASDIGQGGRSVFVSRQLSIGHGPQTFTRVVNNTIFGNDGNFAYFPDSIAEPNDAIAEAIDTHQGRQANPVSYAASAQIGDSINFRDNASGDVDFYQFQLDVGDHVVIDINALESGGGLTSVLRLFNAVGQELMVSRGDPAANRDPLIDFTATVPGTYYVGVSGAGNETYSPLSLADRARGASTGDYSIDINVRAPRQYLLVVESGANYPDGTTFQLEDVTGRTATFEFDTGGGVTAGNIPIAINAAWNHPEIARRIEEAINNNNSANNPLPAPLNNKQNLPNGSFGSANPLAPVSAEAFGGNRQERFGLQLLNTAPWAEGERLVIIRNVARMVDINSGIYFNPNPASLLDPVPDNDGRNNSPVVQRRSNTGRNDLNQIIQERGILVSQQATPTVLNNVLANLRFGVEQVDFQAGSDGPVDRNASVPGGMVEGGSLYQNTLFNSNIPFSANDFNVEIPGTDPLFVNAAAGNFFPADFAFSIDSSIDTLSERDEFESIRTSIGLSLSPVLSPDRDSTGQLRVDDPTVDTPSGLGANVYKDRGSLDRADFIGPAAVLVNPQDNDARNQDVDSAVSVVQLQSGIYADFSIQIVDGFEAADPFPGVGVDDRTLTGRVIPVDEGGLPLQLKGPAVTIYQDSKFLLEGIDYTYRFDATSNTIRLTPLAGIWPAGKVYVIKVNNTDRFVIDAPAGNTLVDGDVFRITNETGETAVFEFDSGYNLRVLGTVGGQKPGTSIVKDREQFTITHGTHVPVTFEFDTGDGVSGQNVPIALVSGESAVALADKVVIAINNAALGLTAAAVGNGNINLGGDDTTSINVAKSPGVALSGRPGVQGGTTLQVPVETALLIPAAGAAGIVDGERFQISDGIINQVFEFDRNGIFQDTDRNNVPDNRLIQYVGTESQDTLAQLVVNSISQARLGLSPRYLGQGVIAVGAGPNHVIDLMDSHLRRADRVGKLNDGETFTIDDGSQVVTFEFEEATAANGVTLGNIAIPFTKGAAVDNVVSAMKAAIDGANLGLQTTIVVGTGRLELNDTYRHLTDVSQSSLTTVGVPGGAVPVPVSGSDTDSDVARAIIRSINMAHEDRGFQGVTSELRGGSTLFVKITDAQGQPANFTSGHAAIVGIDNFFLPAVKDLPGNSLKANQATNDTVFTILLPGVQSDFGDAPDPFLGDGRYPTYFSNNGARHVVPATPVLYLGSGVTTETDGQPAAAADGDSDDGVAFPELFFPTLSTTIDVTASADGLLDAWIDWNHDGDWDDPGEQIFADQPVTQGSQDPPLSIVTPPAAALGDTFARFRLSTLGRLSPTGLAVDGEVEDYRIRVLSNEPPVVANSFDDFIATGWLPASILEDGPNLVIDLEDVGGSGQRVFDDVDILNGNNDVLLYQIEEVDNPALATSTLNGKVLSLGLASDQNGVARIVIRATDHAGFSVLDTLTLTVDSVNDPPVAQTDVYNVDEGTVLQGSSVLANDSDAHNGAPAEDNTPLTAKLDPPSSAPAGLVFRDDGTFTYTPPAQFNGSVTFTYRAVDALDAASGLTTVTINVNAVNDPPVVSAPVSQSGTEDIELPLVGISATDPEVQEDSARTMRVTLTASNGTLRATVVPGGLTSLAGNNTGNLVVEGPQTAINALLAGVAYRGKLNFNGSDVLLVTANDLGNTGSGGAKSDQKSVTISLTAVNDPPEVVNPIADRVVPEDGPETVIVLFPGVFADPDDPTGQSLTFSASSDNAVVATSINALQKKLTLTLQPNGNGVAVITVTASDGALTASDTFTVTVTPVNDPPTAVNDSVSMVRNTTTLIDVLANDFDIDNAIDPATLTVKTNPSSGTATVTSGKISYVPPIGFSGVTKFTYTVKDVSGAESAPAEVTVNVKAPPVANNDAVQTNQAQAIPINVLQNDSDPDGSLVLSSVVVTATPAHGTAVRDPQTGQITYTPNALYQGADSFRYTVKDNDGQTSNEATVAIAVVPQLYWQNSSNRFDVTGDGNVSPIDVLQVINRLNRGQPLPIPPTSSDQPAPWYDVTGDNLLTPLDALQLINRLNAGGSGEGEAEGEGEAGSTVVSLGAGWAEYRLRGVVDLAGVPENLLSGQTSSASGTAADRAHDEALSQFGIARDAAGQTSAAAQATIRETEEVLEDLLDNGNETAAAAVDLAFALFGGEDL
jgi:hypothetical protein